MEGSVGSEYAFRVRGRLSPDIVAALDPLRTVGPATETVLRGAVTDQAALHGIIARFEQLGVELLELTIYPLSEDAAEIRRTHHSDSLRGWDSPLHTTSSLCSVAAEAPNVDPSDSAFDTQPG